MKKAGKVIAVACGTFFLLLSVLQTALNLPFVSRKVECIAAGRLDANLSLSRIRFSLIGSFPSVRVTVDSLSLTYPRDRFAGCDRRAVHNRLQNLGRGEKADTLLRFDRLTASVNPWHLFAGRIRLCDAGLEGAAVFAHRFDTTANWHIIKPSADSASGYAKSSGSPGSLPWLSVRNLSIARGARLVYTDAVASVYASAVMDSLSFEGDLKIGSGADGILYSNVSLDVDSLRLQASVPPDNYDIFLHSLTVTNPGRHLLDVNIDALARAVMKRYGNLEVPLSVNAEIGCDFLPSMTEIGVHRLDADAAYVPLRAKGYVHLLRDSVRMSLEADITDCDAGKVMMTYGPNFVDIPQDLPVCGRLNAGINVEGYLADGVRPDVGARISLDASVPGTSVSFDGRAREILGVNPSFDVHTRLLAVLDSLARFVPESAGISASGDVDLTIDAMADMAGLRSYRFSEAGVTGHLFSDRISLRMPADTLNASARRTEVILTSNSGGLDVKADFDSVFFRKGKSLRVRSRGMKNSFKVCKVEERGQMTPRILFDTDNSGIFANVSGSRIGLSDVSIGAAVQKKVRPGHPKRRRAVAGDEFAADGITVRLDSSVAVYLRQWEPSGRISAGRGFFSSPSIPLRTRLSAIDGRFTGNGMDLDTLSVRIGTSDLAAKGSVSGIRRLLRGRGVLKADLSVNSRRINLNELLVALNRGREVTDANPDSEDEGSFVVDSISGADVGKEKLGMILVPGNVDASLVIKAQRVDYSDIRINPLAASLRMKDKTLQLSNADAFTNLGSIHLDAFYSTKSRSDISAGIGLKMRDVSAGGIIHLLPTVDDIMPALKSFHGNFGLDLSATARIDTNMFVVIPSVDGIMRISGRDLNVSDAGDLKRITRLLLFRNKNIGDIRNLSVDAVVHDSKLEVFPFELAVDRYKLALRGMQGLDGKMNYHVSVMKSPFLIPFGINIFGYTDNWRFSLGAAKYREGRIPVYSEQLDTMQVNIVRSIKDIYRKGVNNVREQTGRMAGSVGGDFDFSDARDSDSLQQLDELSFDMAAAIAEEELDAEIEAALSENVIDLDKLLKEYEAANVDRSIERRIRKLKK